MREVDEAARDDASEEILPDKELQTNTRKGIQVEVCPEKGSKRWDLGAWKPLERFIQPVERDPHREVDLVEHTIQQIQCIVVPDEFGFDLLLTFVAEFDAWDNDRDA